MTIIWILVALSWAFPLAYLAKQIKPKRRKALPRRKTLSKAKTAAYRAADNVDAFSMFDVVTFAEEEVGWICKYGHKNKYSRAWCFGTTERGCSEQRPKKPEGDLFKLPEVAPPKETISIGRSQEPEIPEGSVEWFGRLPSGIREAIANALMAERSVPSVTGTVGPLSRAVRDAWGEVVPPPPPLPPLTRPGHLLTCQCALCRGLPPEVAS